MSDLCAALQTTGLTIETLLALKRPLELAERRALGITPADEASYLRAFRQGYELGDEFFPRVAPAGAYMLGWNHGRDAKAMHRSLIRH